MQSTSFVLGKEVCTVYFSSSLNQLKTLTKNQSCFYLIDENVWAAHAQNLPAKNYILIPSGEQHKTMAIVASIVQQLLQLGANRKSILIGIGGGVVTDLTGFVASIYMRGIAFGFVPTTVLALVDASLGGKNGVDVGLFKNMVGIIRQPQFIVHDYSLLNTLPLAEWQNGFAEIIKHACIKDASLFKELQQHDIAYYQKNKKALAALINANSTLKLAVVKKDPYEKNIRKLLNFGHTLGHAIENKYKLSHGQAISIGMFFACQLSNKLNSFDQTNAVENLLQQYGLPTKFDFIGIEVFDILVKDKKASAKTISYILLQKIGKATIEEIPLTQIKKLLK